MDNTSGSEEVEQQKQPPVKKYKAAHDLKSSKANVKVVVGKGKYKSVHEYHLFQLASHSPWIDEQLSDMVQEEKEEYELLLEDVETKTWLEMMKFILSPLEACKMTKEDVIEVVAGYHKYEFVQGLSICDHLLTEYIKSLEEQDKAKTLKVPFMTKAIGTAHKYHLAQAHKIGFAFVKKIFLKKNGLNLRKTDLAPSDIKQLVPTFESLVKEDESFLSKLLPPDSAYQHKSAEDIQNPMFPHFFFADWRRCNAGWYLLNTVHKKIKMSGAVWDGTLIESFILDNSTSFKEYTQTKKTVSIDSESYHIKISYIETTSSWLIMGRAGDALITLWEVNVGGKCDELPPKTGWKPAHPLASGAPIIEFLDKK